jgi:hypothetical protein
MFDALLIKANNRIISIREYLSWFDVIDSDTVYYNKLQRSMLAEEKIFRHCAVIGQLYSLYENFSEDLLAAWLNRLSKYYKHDELSLKFQARYRRGISKILADINKNKHRKIDLEKVVDRYLGAIRNDINWEIIPEAITSHENNLRSSELAEMFKSSNIENVLGMIDEDVNIRSYLSLGLAENPLASKVLDNFVQYRNDATHGDPENILGVSALYSWVEFIYLLNQALYYIITVNIIKENIRTSPHIVIGEIIKLYSNNISIVKMCSGSIEVQKKYYIVKNNKYNILDVLSIQIEGIDTKKVSFSGKEIDIGIKTSNEVVNGSLLVSMP